MNYFEVYRKVWDFHKQHSRVSSDSQYWDSVVDGISAIESEYSYHPFVCHLCMAVLEELERKHLELIDKGGNKDVSAQ